MTFVPVVPVTETASSPNVQELAGRLSATIREFQQSHPGIRRDEIKEALGLAAAGFGPSITRGVVAVVLGLLAAAGLVVAMVAQRGDFDPTSPTFPMVLIALVVLVLLGVFVAFKTRS